LCIGVIFASARRQLFLDEGIWIGRCLPVRISDQGLQFALSIIKVGYLWPLMKSINLVAGFLVDYKPRSRMCSGTAGADYGRHCLVPNISQSTAGTVGDGCVVILCEVMSAFRAYAKSYGGMFANTSAVASTRTWG